eukprot:CAMPEP_0119516018 /NCGR_PEP_ID=MMETSP1344-20130328/33318_1 /TAXON_ID=236787 /ORGANISM="Florenciella parvula, Strain CCMP2471" /LENGTH=208 /DNA_ID=CAMNT_0007553471 /DNA_START=114 /DNA_END=736 /DNA_ORIENTATION=-
MDDKERAEHDRFLLGGEAKENRKRWSDKLLKAAEKNNVKKLQHVFDVAGEYVKYFPLDHAMVACAKTGTSHLDAAKLLLPWCNMRTYHKVLQLAIDNMMPEYVIMILSAKVSYRGVGQGMTTHAGHSYSGEKLVLEKKKVGGGLHHGLKEFGLNTNQTSPVKRPSTAPVQRGARGGGGDRSGRPGTSHGRASPSVDFDPNISPVRGAA